MKVIFVAKNEFAAYFINSAVSLSVNIIGVSSKYKGLYNSFNIFLAFSDLHPITTRSGRIKSLIAEPSLRNSGFDATSNLRLGFIFFIIFETFSPVPTGTVDLLTITEKFFKFFAISSATA